MDRIDLYRIVSKLDKEGLKQHKIESIVILNQL